MWYTEAMSWKQTLRTIGTVLGLLPLNALSFSNTDMAIGLVQVCAVMGGACNGGGASGLTLYLAERLLPAIRVAFLAIAIVVLMVAIFTMIVESGDEGKVKDSRMAFVYTLIGGIVVSLVSIVVPAISPAGNANGIIVEQSAITDAIETAIFFLLALLKIAIILNVVVQGFRLIASRGEQDQIDRAKKRLIATFIGAIIVLLADEVVSYINPSGSDSLALEFVGLANYLLTFVAVIAVMLIVIAGIMYILSADEALKDRAKTIIKVAVLAIVVILVSYPLVASFGSLGGS